jgi:nitroreductase
MTARSVVQDIDTTARDVFEAVRSRRSVRAYKPDPVPIETLREIVEVARHAPSGSNLQPWHVHVLRSATLQRVSSALKQAFDHREPSTRDYKYYTDPVYEPYLARKRQCGWGLYGTLGVARGDRENSKLHQARNYDFFGAPVGLVYTIDRKLEIGSWLDYGMFLQTIMLAARARGLHTCPQAAIANYPDIIRRELQISSGRIVICGMALGYADASAIVNTFQPPRIALDDYAVFLD